MSKAPCDTALMNKKKTIGTRLPTTLLNLSLGHRVIARFGTARLVRQPNGRHLLIGGTADDCAEAREWCSLFAPEVVFSSAPPSPGMMVLVA
jgi:hypothetical protein